MLKNLLASIGIGGAKVDTIVNNPQLAPGETLEGVVRMQGGSVDQQVASVTLRLITHCQGEDSSFDVEIGHFTLTEPMLLRAGQSAEIPFAFDLPYYTPVSVHKSASWLRTGLAVSGAVDPQDTDRLQVLPTIEMERVLQAMEGLGFRLREVETLHSKYGRWGAPVVQEFEYAPSPELRGRLSEVELYLFPEPGQFEVIMQIDRKAKGFSGMLSEMSGMSERYVQLKLSPDQLANPAALSQALQQSIRRFA